MKKLFLTICFSIIGWQIIDASAKTVAFEDMEAAQAYKASQDNLPPPPPEDDSPDPRDTRAMEKYIMERLKKQPFPIWDRRIPWTGPPRSICSTAMTTSPR